jgi:ParB-like chromosome segregation protein Spo0J
MPKPKEELKSDVRMVDPRTLSTSQYNPRKISEHDFESLCNSIKEFGFVEPVVVQASRQAIIGGHQRVRAAIVLHIEKIPAAYLEITDIRAKALNVALNRIQGTFDTPLLQQVLADLDAGGIDLGLTGFTQDELSNFDEELEGAAIEEMSLRPAPSLIWVLLGVPLHKFADAQPHIADLEKIADISVQSSRDS